MNKEELINICLEVVNKKLSNIQKAIEGYKIDLLSEAKSSAGDKHETGRAMLQLEMEKLGQQYQTVLIQKNTLSKITLTDLQKIGIGSLILANGYYYFIATSIGQINLDDKKVMVISVNSPIGKLLLGKQKNDFIDFNGKSLMISEVF